MTAAELIRELKHYNPDSEVLVAIVDAENDWRDAAPLLVYWDADAMKVIIEGQGV